MTRKEFVQQIVINAQHKDFVEKIIDNAQSDEGFKRALLDNPKKTLGQLGIQVPEEVEIKAVEESAKVVYLVLPASSERMMGPYWGSRVESCAKIFHTCPDFCAKCNVMKLE